MKQAKMLQISTKASRNIFLGEESILRFEFQSKSQNNFN